MQIENCLNNEMESGQIVWNDSFQFECKVKSGQLIFNSSSIRVDVRFSNVLTTIYIWKRFLLKRKQFYMFFSSSLQYFSFLLFINIALKKRNQTCLKCLINSLYLLITFTSLRYFHIMYDVSWEFSKGLYVMWDILNQQ